MKVEIGTIVTFEAQGGRGDNGQARIIPAIVMAQHPDGSLQLFAFHFEGSHLVHAIPADQVKIAIAPAPDKKLASFSDKYSLKDKS